MKTYGKKLLIFSVATIALLLAPHHSSGRKIKTTHPVDKKEALKSNSASLAGKETVVLTEDSMGFSTDIAPKIKFYGFDKTAGSGVESFFIVNSLNAGLYGLGIEITYFDKQGRQLHRREVNVGCDIPAGDTQRIDIKSWDTQKSFYFHKSVKPKRQATAFDVKIRLLSIEKSL